VKSSARSRKWQPSLVHPGVGQLEVGGQVTFVHARSVPPGPGLTGAEGHSGAKGEDLCGLCNDEALPPLVQAALGHAQFETIHPFIDGNRRTGRALIHVPLRHRRLTPSYVPPISVVLARNRGAFITGLTAYRRLRRSRIEGGVACCVRHDGQSTSIRCCGVGIDR
jgi:hypothetical protein